MNANKNKRNHILRMLLQFILVLCLITQLPLAANISEPDHDWKITSYSDDSGNQGMFYTIYNEAEETLIVIDGGWRENADHVRKVLADLGNHVNAWIVTHYHGDHVGAFNEIFLNPKGISIDKVYDSPIDEVKYLEVAKEWDTPEEILRYHEITKERKEIIHVQRDTEVEISDLKILFINTYDSFTDKIKDIPNNASLTFKVFGKTQSMLFTADCESGEIGDLLLERYGELLKSDYYQAPHHGNSKNWLKMIETVQPGYVFLDGPQWLMEGENWKAKDIISYCKEHEIQFSSYMTAPNTVVIR